MLKHFTARMGQRHVSTALVEKIMADGEAARTGTVFRVTPGRHQIVLVRYTCRLILITVTTS